jgi:hypothetical protein
VTPDTVDDVDGTGASDVIRPKAPAVKIDRMLPRASPALLSEAMAALRGSAVAVGKIRAEQSGKPGLYAFYAAASTWNDLGLGRPLDGRPLYIGKAENTFASRDVDGHFGLRARGVQSPTGSSTLRCSLAALMAPERGYRGIPRNPAKPGSFSNFGLSIEHDNDLSAWTRRRLRLVLWRAWSLQIVRTPTPVTDAAPAPDARGDRPRAQARAASWSGGAPAWQAGGRRVEPDCSIRSSPVDQGSFDRCPIWGRGALRQCATY